MTILELIDAGAEQLLAAGVAFGHGTSNAFDEAAWLVLWRCGLPLDSALEGEGCVGAHPVTAQQQDAVAALLQTRITSRQPAAYLTGEAWLQGVPFYIDARAIVPRSFIAELLVGGELDYWLPEGSQRVLDLCTGGGSLAVLAAMAWPDVSVDAADISADALAVAKINLERHQLTGRVSLLHGDGLAATQGPYGLMLCNPPYVNSASMAALPLEYRAEPALALAGGADGMDFVRRLLRDANTRMSAQASLVLELGNERGNFEAAFPALEAVWLDTSAGGDQVCVLTRAALAAHAHGSTTPNL